jgi:hypothetical protein
MMDSSLKHLAACSHFMSRLMVHAITNLTRHDASVGLHSYPTPAFTE